MSDSNWLGILGSFWLSNLSSESNSSKKSSSVVKDNRCVDWKDYQGSSVEYVPEDEKMCARNFVHRYVTDGKSIYTSDEFCIFVNRLGVVYQEGQDNQGLPNFNIYSCKKKDSLAILQCGTFWNEDTMSRFLRQDSGIVLSSLARRGFSIDKRKFRVVYKYDLLKEAYPDTFRYLSREESYYYWKSLKNR